MSIRQALTGAILLTVIGAGCGPDDGVADSNESCQPTHSVDDRPLRVAATVAPITNIAANIAGGTDTEVVGIVPEGVNSHTYSPVPSVAATLEDADLVLLNGLQLEQPTLELARANVDANAVICSIGEQVLSPADYIFDFSFPESGGKPNPHLWTNPVMAGEYATVIHGALVAADPDDAATYDANLAAFLTRVDEFDAALRQATATIPAEQRLLLTFHDAYAYFAREYGWEVVGAIQPSSFDEPTPRDVADLINQVRQRNVPAVFGSEVFPSPVLEQIAAEGGATYVDDLRDDDLPGAPGDPDHTWLALMQFDYVTIIESLGGDASALAAVDVSSVAPDTADYPQ